MVSAARAGQSGGTNAEEDGRAEEEAVAASEAPVLEGLLERLPAGTGSMVTRLVSHAAAGRLPPGAGRLRP
jgi:hypothetical protein